jgi:hypothetical protein
MSFCRYIYVGVQFARVGLLSVLLLILLSCSKSTASTVSARGVAGVKSSTLSEPGGGVGSLGASASVSTQDAFAALLFESFSPAVDESMYRLAAEADATEVLRYLARHGSDTFIESTASESQRAVAVAALGFSGSVRALPALATLGRADTPIAEQALEAAHAIAAEPRLAVDPEDAAELREGCDALLTLARDAKCAKKNRMIAVGTLRMLENRGCVLTADIPSEFDTK